MLNSSRPDTAVRAEPPFTRRQAAVLEAALGLLVEGGEKALTTSGVARAANCSKESLYKWFGDRDGLLSAMVAFQASKVRTFGDSDVPLTRAAFREHLVTFARDLLDVLAGEVSLALNRLAIGKASRDEARLGQLVLQRGRRMIGTRAGAFLDAGRRQGFIDYEDRDAAFRTLYGLIVGDLHVRLLLGDAPAGEEGDFAALAERAVDQFLALHATQPDPAPARERAART